MVDVAECNVISVPSQEFIDNIDTPSDYSKDFLLQFALIGLGKIINDKTLEDELLKLRANNIPFAAISFRIPTNNKSNEKIKNEEKSKLAREIEKTIRELIIEIKELHTDKTLFSKSKIPMVDIMYEKFSPEIRNKLRTRYKQSTNRSLTTIGVQLQEYELKEVQEEEEEKENQLEDLAILNYSKKPIENEFEFLPKIKDQSLVVSYESFIKLLKKVPTLYRVYDWKLTYSMTVNGISLHNLYRRAKDCSPYILLIKDSKDTAFGAFITSEIHESSNFYGTGETFLFTFKENRTDPKCYYWTSKNDYFVYTDESGITIGSGGNYGLFVDKDLLTGRTFKCDTFDNEPLAESTDFKIMKLEVKNIFV